ncbi:Porin ompk36 [Raoultella terrigena]|uniref:Porin ompk36 n=1 Tax=Raoultella terrigena TaxID=577 RepID=A0A3P8JQT1_RAOTE|nr:Porin ompk36 [Raoultella terrigena]
MVAQYQFDFGLRPSVAYLQSKGKDIEGFGDQDILKYVDVGATYYFNKNMSTYVDYKINLLDDSDFTRRAGISTETWLLWAWFTSSKHAEVTKRRLWRLFLCLV